MDEDEPGPRWWWNDLSADAGPLDVVKRVVPGLIGVFAILLLPTSLYFVAGAGMVFDAPGSETHWWLYGVAFWFMSYPLFLIACATFGFLAFFHFTRKRLVLTVAIPLIWWLPVSGVQWIAGY
jgi:small-conductance mechanosensitive channel